MFLFFCLQKSSTSSSPIEERGPSIGLSVEGESPVVLPKDTINHDGNTPQTANAQQLVSPKPKHPISETTEQSEAEDTGVETADSSDEGKKSDEESSNESNNEEDSDYYSIEEQRKMIAKLRIVLNGRNILDLGANLRSSPPSQLGQPTTSSSFVTSAELPANNLKMFLANRSQYHRLGANGHIQEYALAKCTCCDFIYPTNGYSNNIYNNTNGSLNQMANDARTVEENSMAAGVLAYLRSASTTTNETGPGIGGYHNEYYNINGTTNNVAPVAAADTTKYSHYPQPTAAMVNALLNTTKEPNFINNNININNNYNNKHMYNANTNLNNMTALNRILNSGNNLHVAAAAAAFNNSPIGGKSSIESLAAALLSQNYVNANATTNNNNYHPIHNQHHHNQHHKMTPPQNNNYGYYKQF